MELAEMSSLRMLAGLALGELSYPGGARRTISPPRHLKEAIKAGWDDSQGRCFGHFPAGRGLWADT